MSNVNYYDTKLKDGRDIRVVMGDYMGYDKWYKFIYLLDNGDIIAAHEKDDSYSVLTDIILKSHAKKLMDELNPILNRQKKLKYLLDDE